jgi:LysM repeat protein
MKKSKKTAVVFLGLGMTVLMACGCAAKRVDNTEVPQQPAANETAAAPTPVPTAAPGQQYTVKEGDTLWAISRQTGIYSNSAEWPLIFKTNRDQIQDPDEINPGQVLTINEDESTDQINHAEQLANDTPAFVAHSEPRKPLPIDYF